MKTLTVDVLTEPGLNVILGQSHFIKTVEDLYEALVNSVPNVSFGLAFCEASGDCLVRTEGTDPALVELAAKNALGIGAGHSFIILLRDAFPVNVLNAIKNVPEVCRIYAATANPLKVVVAESLEGDGRGILGVIDGHSPLGVEDDSKIKERKEFLRKIGYKR